MSKLSIRECCIDDVDIIVTLEKDCEEDVYSRGVITNSLQNENYYNIILCVDSIIVGYLSASIVLDECELLKIVVAKKYRKLGYGKLLINELKKYCGKSGVLSIYLEVRKDNESAKALYEKTNFIKVNERKGYYNGIDAIIYWCKLDDKKN